MNIVIANWKMNPQTAKEAKALFEAEAGAGRFKSVEVVICAPFVFLSVFSLSKNVKLGVQNLFWEPQGAYTGEISGKMLKEFGCEYVIIGHSERRQFLGETDQMVNLKLKAALKLGLAPILCVGEREGEEMGEVVGRQLKNGLTDIAKNQIEKVIVTYEPVWAISANQDAKPCLPDDALGAAVFIRKILTELFGHFLAGKVRIIYGGSVDSGNAASYIKEAQMAGVLVGGASLDGREFLKLTESVNSIL